MGNVSGIEFKVVCPENLDTEASGLTQRQKHSGRPPAPCEPWQGAGPTYVTGRLGVWGGGRTFSPAAN